MRFAIAYSKKDPAGINIVAELKKFGYLPHIPIIELKNELVFSDDLNPRNYPQLRNIDFLIFASKHQSAKGEHSLSLHAPGNWRSADFGGQESKVCPTSAYILKYLFLEMNKKAKEENLLGDYKITLEATHHGPFISMPCCFIEIGSSEEQWKNPKAGRALAKTIFELQNFNKENYNWKSSIAIGGPHYCPGFNRIQLETEYAISHIIPEYALPLTEKILKEAEEKTIEQIDTVLLDWKGIGRSEERKKTLDLLSSFGLKFKRTNQI